MLKPPVLIVHLSVSPWSAVTLCVHPLLLPFVFCHNSSRLYCSICICGEFPPIFLYDIPFTVLIFPIPGSVLPEMIVALTVLVCRPVAEINTVSKSSIGEEMAYFSLRLTFHHRGKAGQDDM